MLFRSDIAAFKVCGPNCALLFATREVAVASSASPHRVVQIEELSRDHVLALMNALAPRAVALEPATTAMVERLYPKGFQVSFGPEAPPCKATVAKVAEQMGVAPVVPAIDEVLIDPRGAFWVRRYAFPETANRYDVFDSTGSYQGSLEVAGTIAGFPTVASLLVIAPDTATGGHRLVGYRIVGR